MVIIYESKTGFTKKYAEMLAAKTGLKVHHVKEMPKVGKGEDIVFLGWMMAGKIQGLNKVRKYNVKAVCCTGLGRTAEPDNETVITRNKIVDIPFFYMQGGCLPLKDLKGMNKLLMSMFVKMMKTSKDKDAETLEGISQIENGFDGVKEENLEPVIKWIKSHDA